jgi:hypothetical protein
VSPSWRNHRVPAFANSGGIHSRSPLLQFSYRRIGELRAQECQLGEPCVLPVNDFDGYGIAVCRAAQRLGRATPDGARAHDEPQIQAICTRADGLVVEPPMSSRSDGDLRQRYRLDSMPTYVAP